MNRLKHIIKYIVLKIKYSDKLFFSFSCDINRNSEFKGMNKIYPYTSFSDFLGLGAYIASYCELNAQKISLRM